MMQPFPPDIKMVTTKIDRSLFKMIYLFKKPQEGSPRRGAQSLYAGY